MKPVMKPTVDQSRVIETWGVGLAVIAGAGSGKTSTLVKKCVAAVARNPKAKICAVSFTEKSAADLRAKLSDQFPLSGHWVMTIHGLCSAILSEFPREGGFDGEESILAEDEAAVIWDRALEVLWYNDLSPEIEAALNLLCARESKAQLVELLTRVRDIRLFGVVESLIAQEGEAHALGLLAEFVLERYARLKRRRAGVDFSDLEQAARSALAHDHVARSFHERFDLVLVDEFQDTNPLQAQMIWRLIRPDASNLVVVGDPKQSIYRFRDADVTVFEEYIRKLPVQIVLSENFRSRVGILEFCNQVCAPAFEAAQMQYDPLSPPQAVPPEDPSGAEPSVNELRVTEPKELALWVKSEVARGVKLEDMVLLLRSVRGSGWKWIEALAAEGIPLSVASGGLFWKDPRVGELVGFLKWWVWPTDTIAGAAFLRAPWLNIPDTGETQLTDAQLEEWLLSPDPLTEFLKSNHWAAKKLAPLAHKVVSPGELLAQLLTPEVEPELGVAWLGVWNRCHELSSNGFGIAQVALLMDQWVQEGKREREVPPPRSIGSLQVLTVHGSKGLEFKHVILADFDAKPARAKPLPWLFYQRQQGVYLSARDEEGTRLEGGDLEKSFILQERLGALGEVKRVFYVALTRAIHRLILVTPVDGAQIKDESKIWETDHWLGWIQASGAKTAVIETSSQTPASPQTITLGSRVNPQRPSLSVRESAPLEQIPTRPRHSITEWNGLSHCERLYQWQFLRRPEGVLPALQKGRETLKIETHRADYLTTRELGTQVHALLEESADPDFEEKLAALADVVGNKRLDAQALLRWTRSSPLMAPGLEHWSEFAFEVPFENQVLVGAMDRLLYNASTGRYTIVDFKVTAKDLPAVELKQKYETQLNLYVWALGQLEPKARDLTDCVLVHIGPTQVQEIVLGSVLYSQLTTQVKKLATTSAALVRGVEAKPQPSLHCHNCIFEKPCLTPS